jgi:hypothetical protein
VGIVLDLRWINVRERGLWHPALRSMEATMGLAATIRQWQSSWARTNEFAALEQDQREALARDTGLSEDVLGKLMAQGPEAAAELPLLMRTLGLAPEMTERMHPAVMRDMSIVCSGCTHKRRCRNDIDCGWAPVVQRYCPNTHTIKAPAEGFRCGGAGSA